MHQIANLESSKEDQRFKSFTLRLRAYNVIGSITVSKTVSLGSSPSAPAVNLNLFKGL